MARVKHKKVRQLLDEKRSKITDRQFFTSRILAGHFEDIAAAQTRRYKYNRRIHVYLYWDPKDPNVACTDNFTIRINCGHKVVTKHRGRQKRYIIVMALFAHELGHVLFTDFLAAQTYLRFLEHRKWFPDAPVLTDTADNRRELALWDYAFADPGNLVLVQRVAAFVENTIEDGYVEARVLNQFTGVLGSSLYELRECQLEDMPTVEQMIEEEADGSRPTFSTILQILLSYAKYGQIKYGGTPLTDMRIQTVFRLIPELDAAVSVTSAQERWKVVSLIMIRCWDQIQEYLEYCKQKRDEYAASGGGSTAEQILQELLKKIMGSSKSGEGDSTPVPGSESCGHISAQAAARAATAAQAASAAQENSGESPDGEEASPETADGTPGGKQETKAEEGGRIPLHQTDMVSEPVGGELEYDPDYQREQNDRAAADIDRMLEQMAEKAACKQLENERLQELNEAAQSISYGDIHSGVNIKVHRIAEVDGELQTQYHEISGTLLAISKQLQRSLTQKLKDQQRGGKQTGLVMGRRLDAHALCRNDGKAFYKNNLPNEVPRISVGLLLDESGSMSCGDRATYARAAAIIMYDFCQALHIPIMVYGHSTGWSSGVDLYSYAEFDSIDHDDKYRMMDIAARGSNRDGAALRFVAEQLSRRTEEVRILMLVSDGQPADTGYGGTAAEEDLRGIKQEYRRKGLLFVAAAIGDDKANIERIYGDSFLDITDLNQLPVKLTSVIKRFLKF